MFQRVLDFAEEPMFYVESAKEELGMASLNESDLSSLSWERARSGNRRKGRWAADRVTLELVDSVDGARDLAAAAAGLAKLEEDSTYNQSDYMACAILHNVTATHDTSLSKVC